MSLTIVIAVCFYKLQCLTFLNRSLILNLVRIFGGDRFQVQWQMSIFNTRHLNIIRWSQKKKSIIHFVEMMSVFIAGPSAIWEYSDSVTNASGCRHWEPIDCARAVCYSARGNSQKPREAVGEVVRKVEMLMFFVLDSCIKAVLWKIKTIKVFFVFLHHW